jgi:hypothetical protein
MENPIMTVRQNDEFNLLLNETKAKLGKNVQAVAEDILLRKQLDMERKVEGKASIQEKISFVKMEYFLYVFVEAHRLIKELEKLQYTIPLT